MALYRNIAGFDPFEGEQGDQVGLIVRAPGSVPTIQDILTTNYGTTFPRESIAQPISELITETGVPLPTGGGTRGTTDLAETQAALQQAFADLEKQKEQTYNTFLAMSLYDFAAGNYFVDPDGSIGQYYDSSHQGGKFILAIQDIQRVENERGTAGTLLMHLNQPTIAKNTAGYAGGGSKDFGSTLYSTPIPEVLALPDVNYNNPDLITDYQPETQIPIYQTAAPTGTNTQPPATTPAQTNNTTANQVTTQQSGADWLPLITLGGLFFTIFKGEQVFKSSRKLAFIAGLGTLYFELSRKK